MALAEALASLCVFDEVDVFWPCQTEDSPGHLKFRELAEEFPVQVCKCVRQAIGTCSSNMVFSTAARSCFLAFSETLQLSSSVIVRSMTSCSSPSSC